MSKYVATAATVVKTTFQVGCRPIFNSIKASSQVGPGRDLLYLLEMETL